MPFELNSPGWRIRAARRGARAVGGTAPGLPPGFLTEDSRVAEEVVLEATPATRGQPSSGGMLDLTCDVEPGEAAILAIRHASNALTFHLPVQSTSRGRRSPSQARFQIAIRQGTKRGLASQAIKAIVVKVARLAGDKLVTLVLPKLVEAFEKNSWKKRGLEEGWLLVTEDTLAAAALATGTPVSPQRSLLFIHGTFSDTASAFRPLASSSFFERVKDVYDDRIFAFDHFSLSRTLEENARMLLEGLPEQTTTFDVITHSRGGLVLRTLVERASRFGPLARRFSLGRAVLVASPNEGTPLATPGRWDQTLGWIANVLELFQTTPSRPVRNSWPTASCGWPITSRATFPACTPWTRRAIRSPRSRSRPALPPTRTPRWWPTTIQPATCCTACSTPASISFSGRPTTS